MWSWVFLAAVGALRADTLAAVGALRDDSLAAVGQQAVYGVANVLRDGAERISAHRKVGSQDPIVRVDPSGK